MHVLVDKELPRKAAGEGPKVECPCPCKESRAEKEPDGPEASASVHWGTHYKLNG
jgi:hypothetical protein